MVAKTSSRFVPLIATLSWLVACSNGSFQGSSGKESGTASRASGTSSAHPGAADGTPAAGDSSGFHLVPIKDQVIDTAPGPSDGKSFIGNVAEELVVPLSAANAKGQVTYTVETEPPSPNAVIKGSAFHWLPGTVGPTGETSNEAGDYKVTVTATDATGYTAKGTFGVSIKPITSTFSSMTDVSEHVNVSTFTFHEPFHPERTYNVIPAIGGARLQASACTGLVPGAQGTTDQFANAPLSYTKKTNPDGSTDHTFTERVPIGTGSSNFVYEYWLGVQSPQGGRMLLNWVSDCYGVDPSSCEAVARQQPAASTYFLCTDYVPPGMASSRSELAQQMLKVETGP